MTEHTTFNPVTRVQTSWLAAGELECARRVSLKNRFDEVEREERLRVDDSLVSRHVFVYDGLGRRVSVTEPEVGTTTFTYDVADRIETQTLPDDTVVKHTYAPHSLDDAVAGIYVNDVPVGEREFDGLMRVVCQTVGARKSTWKFDGDRVHPCEETTPAGDTLVYDVNPSLPTRMMHRTSGTLRMAYDYDPQSGLMLSATSQTGGPSVLGYTCKRDSAGNLCEETWADDEGERVAEHTWTLTGRPSSYTDVTGKVHEYHYDASIARLSDVKCADIHVELTYDAFNRVHEQILKQGGAHKLRTTLTYDDLGREILREFEAPSHPVFSISQTYDGLDRIVTRERKLGDSVELSETFSYDTRSRPNLYYAIGTLAPHDPHAPDQQIQVQQWEYDELDNVTKVTTWHQGPDKPPGVATYHYDNPVDPTRLTSLVRSDYGDANGTQTFRYDDAGRMIEVEGGHSVTYNAFDQIVAVSRDGVEQAAYRYNGMDEQTHVSMPSQPVRKRMFREHRLVTEIRGTFSKTYLPGGLGDIDEAGTLHVYATDRKSSVAHVLDAQGQRREILYSPSGYRLPDTALDGVPGQDGEMVDTATQWVWLGNSRMYSPVLARFMVPDSFVPFDGGGYNGYARLDPVNTIDPSGHVPKWLLIVAAVAVAVVAIAAAVVTAGGLTAIATAATISAKAIGAKVGLAAAGSAKLLATMNGVKVTASIFSTMKFALGTAGSLATMSSGILRATGDTSGLAVVLGLVGSALTVAAFVASVPGLKTTYTNLATKRMTAKEAFKAASAQRSQPIAMPVARSSSVSSLRSSGGARSFGRPSTPASTARRASAPASLPTQEASATASVSRSQIAAELSEPAIAAAGQANMYASPVPMTGGGLPQPVQPAVWFSADELRGISMGGLNYYEMYAYKYGGW
ncbi:RHS repeat domain-containing protein [Pandoraea anhela]|uniref:tRNA(Glu)-specific nuclease WapA n=1 Tax=Pandoraea anhela TaxID=2508295 RepID=A0A5E4TWR7_9BURK|nr:hypothetical protein [Pandoraea anhela]VVD91188.1 tRNA(Glu)-specific nuclease WapA [Pandoraea anhela]